MPYNYRYTIQSEQFEVRGLAHGPNRNNLASMRLELTSFELLVLFIFPKGFSNIKLKILNLWLKNSIVITILVNILVSSVDTNK